MPPPLHIADVFTHGGTSRFAASVHGIEITYRHDNVWANAVCTFLADSPIIVPCSVLSEISSASLCPVRVRDASGEACGAMSAHGLITRQPPGADCMIFRQLDNGFWSGFTLATAYGRLVLQPYEFDPS